MRLKQYAYNNNGQLVVEYFIDSKTFRLEGEEIEYTNNKITKICNYKDGKKDGLEILFTEDKIIISDYIDGMLERSRFYVRLGDLASDRGDLLEEVRFENNCIVSRLEYNQGQTTITEFKENETIYKVLHKNKLVKQTIIKPNSEGEKMTSISKFDNEGVLTSLMVSLGDNESLEPIFYYEKTPYKLYSKDLNISVQSSIEDFELTVKYDETTFLFDRTVSIDNLKSGAFKKLFSDINNINYLITYHFNNGVLDRILVNSSGNIFYASIKNGVIADIGYSTNKGFEVFDFNFKWYSLRVLKAMYKNYDLVGIRRVLKQVLDKEIDLEFINNKIETIKNRIDIVENIYLNETQN